MCVPQSLDPICGKFDKFLAHGQAHMGQMGIWLWQCTPTGLDNSTELRMEKIPQAVTEIWVPQVWQPPAQPPSRPPARTVTTIPLQPGGLRGKNWCHFPPKSTQLCYNYCLTTPRHHRINHQRGFHGLACGIHQRAIYQETLKISILDMNFKIINLRLQPYLPGANELIALVTPTHIHTYRTRINIIIIVKNPPSSQRYPQSHTSPSDET